MRLIGSFHTITTHGRCRSAASSPLGCSTSTSAGASVVVMVTLWPSGAGALTSPRDAGADTAAPARRSSVRGAVRGRPPLLPARQEEGVADPRPSVGRGLADPRDAPGARPRAQGTPPRPLAVGDHPAAAGRPVRGRDGGTAALDRARRGGEALLHDDGAGRGPPHRGVAAAGRPG